jgi:hypothetical protein
MADKKKKDPAAVALARKRSESLTPARRKKIAEDAAAVRWGTKKAKKKG